MGVGSSAPVLVMKCCSLDRRRRRLKTICCVRRAELSRRAREHHAQFSLLPASAGGVYRSVAAACGVGIALYEGLNVVPPDNIIGVEILRVSTSLFSDGLGCLSPDTTLEWRTLRGSTSLLMMDWYVVPPGSNIGVEHLAENNIALPDGLGCSATR